MPRVFDKAITINVSVPIHPFQRHLDVRPEMFQEAEVASTLVICCRKHHEQRRGINASVIATEGDFTEVRHFADAAFISAFAAAIALEWLIERNSGPGVADVEIAT